MSKKAMYDLRNMLCEELDELARKGDLGAGDLEIAHKLTDTRTAEFKAREWVQPQMVQVPSKHGAGVVWARLQPADDCAAGGGVTSGAVEKRRACSVKRSTSRLVLPCNRASAMPT